MLSDNVREDNSFVTLHFLGSLYMSIESAASKPWFYVATLIVVVSYEYDAKRVEQFFGDFSCRNLVGQSSRKTITVLHKLFSDYQHKLQWFYSY